MNKITILGSYGSKSKKGGSTAFMLNHKHVIDAGNLLRPLEEKCAEIETVWLTHSHLDHLSDMAYLLDNYYYKREKTLQIYGLEATLEAVKEHFFNNKIWPDFSKIPLANGSGMSISYNELTVGKAYSIEKEGTIEPVLTDHTVPSCGYIIRKKGSGIIVTADTHSLSNIAKEIKRDKNIRALVVECSFPSPMGELAKLSKHLTPQYLFKELKRLEGEDIAIYINHMKPLYEEQIRAEIEEMKGLWNVTLLKDGDEISF